MRNYNSYSSEFSESSFWSKIKSAAGKAGREVLTKAFELFYAYKDGKLSLAEKACVLGALGYFILPADLVPDWIPVVGYLDDLAALKWAYDTVSSEITPEIEAQAKRQVDRLL